MEKMLKITFSTGDVANFKSTFANFLLTADVSTLTSLKAEFSPERATLWLPQMQDYATLLSDLIKEADDCQVEFLNADNMTTEPLATKETEQLDCNVEDSDLFVTNTSIIRKYISNCQTFSVEHLRQKFPNVTSSTINSLIIKLLKAQAITRTSRGEYKVVNNNAIKITTSKGSQYQPLNSKASKIRNSILHCHTFSIKDVQATVPNSTSSDISTVINQLLAAQLITRTGCGKYKVNSSEDNG